MDFETHTLEVLTAMVKGLVDNADQVKINIKRGEQTTVFEVSVYYQDLGKVIGKEGKNAKAIRQIIFAMASRYRQRAVVEILE